MTHKILAVDDHPETLSIVVQTLEQHGYDVISSRSPQEGLELVRQEEPDLILLDVNMPDMDGYEFARQVRAQPAFAKTPIIMFTAEGEAKQKLTGFDAGADDYLTKPTDPAEMIARIEMMLESREETPKIGVDDNDVAAKASEPQAGLMNRTVALPEEQRLIAVMGARGGAGTTTVAINLALSLAALNRPTVLADFDLMQGHVALYLNHREFSNSLNSLAQQPLDTGVLQQSLIPHRDQLQLLLAQPNLLAQAPAPTAAQTADLLRNLAQPGRITVIDVGRGVTQATRPVLDWADQIVVCLCPERVSLAAARLLLKQLKEQASDASIYALAFHVGAGINIPEDAMQNYLNHPLLATITISTKKLMYAINKGVPLVNMEPDGKAAAQFRRLARQLLEQ